MFTATPGVNTLLMSWGQSDLQIPRDLNRSFNGGTGKNHRLRRRENELCGFFNLRSQAGVQLRLVIDNLWQMFGDLCVVGSQFRFCFTFPEQVCSHPSTKTFSLWEPCHQIFHTKAKHLMGIKFVLLRLIYFPNLKHLPFTLCTQFFPVHNFFPFLKEFFWIVSNCWLRVLRADVFSLI